jgi:hypothetical protein
VWLVLQQYSIPNYFFLIHHKVANATHSLRSVIMMLRIDLQVLIGALRVFTRMLST